MMGTGKGKEVDAYDTLSPEAQAELAHLLTPEILANFQTVKKYGPHLIKLGWALFASVCLIGFRLGGWVNKNESMAKQVVDLQEKQVVIQQGQERINQEQLKTNSLTSIRIAQDHEMLENLAARTKRLEDNDDRRRR